MTLKMRKALVSLIASMCVLGLSCAWLPSVARADEDVSPLTAYQGFSVGGELNAQGGLATQSVNKNHFGIDVSQWQYGIDWPQVATSVEFAIIRCGYGSDHASQDDKYWLANARGCRQAGIPMGVYLYSYAENTSMARSEAMHVVRCMREAGLSASDLMFPIYYDMEQDLYDQNGTAYHLSASEYAACFYTFRDTLAAYGYTSVGVYANCNWWRLYLSAIELSPEYRWVAHWYDDAGLAGVSDPFSGYPELASKGFGIWQYGSADVAGISGAVDANYMRDDAPFLGGVYRVYNPYSGEHFYTQNAYECAVLLAAGWRYEGIGWWPSGTDGLPVYRLYNRFAGDHHYTTSIDEYNTLAQIGWSPEGVAFFGARDGGRPLHRLYNPNAYGMGLSGAHHYTVEGGESAALVDEGWIFEGIGWNVI